MRKKQFWIAALLASVLLLTPGCGKSPDPIMETETTAPVIEPVKEVSGEASLNSLRQTMAGTQKLFAVACFGCPEAKASDLAADPAAFLGEYAPELCREMPFLLEIPADRIIGQAGDLFCIVPLDEDATVAVSKGYWDEENQRYIYDDMLYSSAAGDPILLLCNNLGWEPDTQVYISGPSGEVFWYPQSAELEPVCRFLLKPDAPAPTEMIGSWELAWTEVEGDRNEAEPGTCGIEIRMAASSGFLMSYISREFPHNDFENELLTLDMREMYHGCGNDAWVGDLDYVGPWDTTYTVTLTVDDILIKQNYFLLDGAPSVSYEYFRRVMEHTESPYADALSKGGREPNLSDLTDTFWLSWNGYALDLVDDSVPSDNGGWAILYDVGAVGEYTQSHSGRWSYADGLLHLSLVPMSGDGVLVDDRFPVLMLDGQLWIGRSSSGLGLPHFYSDTLADILEQPEG